MITIISDDSRENYTELIKYSLAQGSEPINILKSNEFNVEPCYGCASCSGKTYGRCIIEDDMQKILPKIVRSKQIILVSPIIYGGVSFHIKKIMDRIASVGDPRYYLNGNELTKGIRISNLKYHMLGIKENLTDEERLTFEQLHNENIKIMNVEGQVFIIDKKLNKDVFYNIFKEIVYE